jgi:hypothetical protein
LSSSFCRRDKRPWQFLSAENKKFHIVCFIVNFKFRLITKTTYLKFNTLHVHLLEFLIYKMTWKEKSPVLDLLERLRQRLGARPCKFPYRD